MSQDVTGLISWLRSWFDNIYQDKLVSGTNIKTINSETLLGNGNITINGSGEQNVFYGTCDTVGTTQIKVVTVDDWSFNTGNILFVKFNDSNKYNGTAIISIDGVEKDIATVGTTKTSRYYWKSGEVVGFVYDGTNMVLLEGGTATTTYYGITKLSSSTTSTSEVLSATPKAVKTAYDLANDKADSVHTHKISDVTNLQTSLNGKQATLVSGTNIKTVNGNSLLGSGNITIQEGGSSTTVNAVGYFSIDSNGHLIVELPNGMSNPYTINANGHLIYNTSGGS